MTGHGATDPNAASRARRVMARRMQPQEATGLEGFPSGLQAARKILVFRVFSFDDGQLRDGFSFAFEDAHGRLVKRLLKWSVLATGGPVTAGWHRPPATRASRAAKGVGRARVAPRGNALATAALCRPRGGAGRRRVQLLAGRTVRQLGTVW